MEQIHSLGAITFAVLENGNLEYSISDHATRVTQINAQATLDFIAWLTAHQNYFALAKIHEDQRVAMLADIAGVVDEDEI